MVTGIFLKCRKSVKILLESLIRMQSHPAYTSQHVELLSKWTPDVKKDEIPYMPQEFYYKILLAYHVL